MKDKYEFTGKTKQHEGRTLHRIRRLSDGLVGGWIEREDNLSHRGDCFVYNDAMVYDFARVYSDANIFHYAQVYGDAEICGDAEVRGHAHVYGDAMVYGYARVYESAKVYDNAEVYGYAHVHGNAEVYGDTSISGKDEIFDNTHDRPNMAFTTTIPSGFYKGYVKKTNLIILESASSSEYYYVNPEHITHIRATSASSHTTVYLSSGKMILVRETLEKIRERINEN